MATHIFLVCLVVLIGYSILQARVNYANLTILILIIIVSYMALTYFIDIHPNAAEGLMVCYLA